jgi:U3 small nucleolar RNA-associated protein 11
VKKTKLKRLREKARDRNPDEFAFGMMSERSRTQGRHGARESTSLSYEALKLLKTQDAGYLRVVGERVRRQLEKVAAEKDLQDGMAAASGGATATRGKKVIFVETPEEQNQRWRDQNGSGKVEAKEEEEDEEELPTQAPREASKERKSKKQLEAERQAFKEMLKARKLKRKAAESRRIKLEALKKQHEEILAAEKELDWQRARSGNSVGGVNKDGIKWKIRERKK